MKKSSFISIISLSVTLLLLIICAFGWYVVNKEAQLENGVMKTHGDESFTFVLEYYDDDSWEVVTNFEFVDMMPGDVISFRLSAICDDNETTTISSRFTGVSSSLHSLIVEDDFIKYNEITLYTITNDMVKIDEKTLYSVKNNVISLKDYKIEDAMKVYYIGQKLMSDTNASDYIPIINDDNQIDISDNFINNVEISSSTYLYFMLRYEDLENNNYYAYQKLTIDKIVIDY